MSRKLTPEMRAIAESLASAIPLESVELGRAEAANQPILKRFWVRVIQAGVVVNQFEAMAEDSTACTIQHMGLVPEGGKLDVMSIAANDEPERTVHTISRTRQGTGLDAKVRLRCACGWSFSADEADDYAYSKLKQQEAHHARGGAL